MATVARAALSLGRGRCGVARQSRGWARHCAGFVHPLPSLGEDEKTEHGFDEGRALPRTGSASMIHRSVPPRRAPKSSVAAEEPSPRMMAAVRTLLEEVGEDPGRGGLQRTPYRYAKALKALTQGYGMSLEDVVNGAKFEENHEEMVMVRDIRFFSLCEHHMLPFFGRASIAYIPESRVIGLSKMARITNMFAQRLQLQERLGAQIAEAVEDSTGARGVGVAIEATHMCMSMRGVKSPGAVTLTTSMRGEMKADAGHRGEFMRWAAAGGGGAL